MEENEKEETLPLVENPYGLPEFMYFMLISVLRPKTATEISGDVLEYSIGRIELNFAEVLTNWCLLQNKGWVDSLPSEDKVKRKCVITKRGLKALDEEIARYRRLYELGKIFYEENTRPKE